MLNEKEKKSLDGLNKGFNIVNETENYNLMAFRRHDISRDWARKLLKASLVINVISIVLMVISLVIASSKPSPQIYVSTPSGKVFPLKALRN